MNYSLDPFGGGAPGDPMEDVLSLQSYDQMEQAVAPGTGTCDATGHCDNTGTCSGTTTCHGTTHCHDTGSCSHTTTCH